MYKVTPIFGISQNKTRFPVVLALVAALTDGWGSVSQTHI